MKVIREVIIMGLIPLGLTFISTPFWWIAGIDIKMSLFLSVVLGLFLNLGYGVYLWEKSMDLKYGKE